MKLLRWLFLSLLLTIIPQQANSSDFYQTCYERCNSLWPNVYFNGCALDCTQADIYAKGTGLSFAGIAQGTAVGISTLLLMLRYCPKRLIRKLIIPACILSCIAAEYILH